VLPLHFPHTYLGESSGSPLMGRSAENTGAALFHPYGAAAGAAEFLPLAAGQVWAWSLETAPVANSYFSNPRLIYLGK
jgi:hypothetical protein